MSFFKYLPMFDNCCGCIPDLKTASAIIAVLGIVTSPAASWAVVRHSYVVRVACFVGTSSQRVDVVDLSLNNIITFGFGVNAGLGPSCLTKNSTASAKTLALRAAQADPEDSEFVKSVKYFGWFVLAADIVFAVISILFLNSIFRRPSQRVTKLFIFAAMVAIIFSCVYGILYVVACMILGGSLPLFELCFSFFDIILWSYFIMVVNSYRLTEFAMGVFGFLPKLNRCCFCTRKLKCASLLIILWSLFVGCHGISMFMYPACPDVYSTENTELVDTLITLKWAFFGITLAMLVSCFLFLLGLTVGFPSRDVTAVLYMLCGLAWAIVSVVFAVYLVMQMPLTDCDNPNDIVFIFFYFPCWIYFILIVNSYIETAA